MRGSCCILMLLAIFALGLDPSKATAQESTFLRISNPVDKQNYAPGATSTVSGLIQLSDANADNDWLILRLRVFRPGATGLVIMTESVMDLKVPAKGKKLLAYAASLKLPTQEGEYVLRVDCLDRKIRKYPESLVATSSVFINIQKPKLPGASHNTVAISTPATNTNYNVGSTVASSGTCDHKDVVKMRLRLLQDSTVMQENIVSVTGQLWGGNLSPPTGGWKEGAASLEAQGLNSAGEPVFNEVASVNLKMVK